MQAKVAEGQEVVQQLESAEWIEVKWDFETNLKYVQPEEAIEPTSQMKCSNCFKVLDEAKRCKVCGASYCSRDCQIKAWKDGHKVSCKLLSKVDGNKLSSTDKQEILQIQLRRIRMYMCPYLVCRTEVHGKGFAFVTSDVDLVSWIPFEPADRKGNMLDRAFKIEFLTLDDFDSLISDNFELGVVRPSVAKLIDAYDKSKEFVCVVLLGCGHFVTATFPLVPAFEVGSRLGKMYGFHELDSPLQLNVDKRD